MKKQNEKTIILSSNAFPVVGIGASAGGLDAFKKLLKAIPENSGMAYVLVQHLDPSHESMLPEILQKVTKIPVLEISDDIKVEPDHIYIIPSNKILQANDSVLLLKPRPVRDKNIQNLPIDLFFTSLAEVHQEHAIGVVLSGTASDGTKGLKAIKDGGGITFAQDEASAAFEGMPNSAVQAGVVDFILPPEEIPQKLLDIKNKVNLSDEEIINTPVHENDTFKQIISLLRIRKGTDFTYYKQTTIRRRILRRMAIKRIDDIVGYLKYLREDKNEQDALYQDLLISVTAFFRDAKVFSSLCDSVFPYILKNREANDPIRIWVAGCSTGEEAYSIAICLKEFLGDRIEKVQIFATDISEPAIDKARAGIYSKKELEGISNERLNGFFTKLDGSYQLNKQIRMMCIFALHNFLKDPPFGKLDFVSCRNVLIYMEPYLQKKALTTFHYALNANGFMLLGKSETGTTVPDLFTIAEKNDKLFRRKDVPNRFMHLAGRQKEQVLNDLSLTSKSENENVDFQKSADDLLLSRYTPAGVVVNEDMEIVHFRGNTNDYLGQGTGKPSHNLLKMAKGGLAFELRNLLHKAKKGSSPVIKENVTVRLLEGQRVVSLEVLRLPNLADPHYLVMFHESLKETNPSFQKSGPTTSSKQKSGEKDIRIKKLEQELVDTHEDMRSITEEQEAANEELQSANEELLSGSEELQSLNEELESSKEELQSTNEELTVLNQELISLNEQITANANYTESIVATIGQPLIVLDKGLRVRTANKAFYKAFQVNEQVTEDVLIYDLGQKQWNIPSLRILLEEILPARTTITDFEVKHNFPTIGERVILLSALEIRPEKVQEKLILLVFEDVTERRKFETEENEAKKRFQFIADVMPQKVWIADHEGNVNYFNKCWLDYTGLSFEDLKDWGWRKIIHPEDWEENKVRWQHSIENGNNFEMEHRFLDAKGKYKWHLSRGLAQKDEFGKIKMWIGTNTEIEEQKRQNQELEITVSNRNGELEKVNESLHKKNEELAKLNHELESFTYIASHDLQEPLRKIQTFSKLILETEISGLSDSGKNYFNRMNNAAKRMQTLIEDLLDYSHNSRADRKYERVNLNNLIDEIKTELEEIIIEKHAIIETTDLCEVYINAFQFRQVFNNLINNSFKFAKTGIAPHIRIESVIEEYNEAQMQNLYLPGQKLSSNKKYCHITFSDNGIGFEPRFKDQIFEVFQRLHGKEEYEGTGIGLAIVKKIVENHNGVITSSSELGMGARFDIYIPVEDIE